MDAGQLRDRVTLLEKTSTTDSQGGRVDTWVEVSTAPRMWAQVRATGASERVQASALTTTVSYQVVLRYRADVSPQMRLTWRPYRATSALTLEVHGVAPLDGGREFLALDCGVVTA